MQLNSYDEWSKLKEVVVGTAINYAAHDRELSFDLFFHDNLKVRSEWYYPRLSTAAVSAQDGERVRHRIKQRYLDELNEDVEGIVDTLRTLNVTVHRPMTLDPSTAEVRTLAWSAAVVPPLNVRDIALVAGDEVIETPPMLRSRYFETQFLKPIFASYFKEGARWSAMPRPLMTDGSFDRSYVLSTTGGPTEPIPHPKTHCYDVGLEMMWDGAQCLRLGRDLVVNIANENHAMACDWLERHLEGRFRIHRASKLSDSHIDSMVIALAPGRLLVRSRAVADYLPKEMRNWDMIVAPEPAKNNFPIYDDDDLLLSSLYIDVNVLSVASDVVLVNDACPELARILEQNRFQVIPVRHRHRRIFGGGFHCFTLDTVREGGPEDYLS
ncbi:glycine amidinotransferase [Bradyrhizobium sp. SBR1B]|uniref:glycine amidinotransferase n=1 Tax=Bradyrhizobium sp. SBR1B TaxID=2663836 RepID=UPI0016065F3A|nr:glycine amidinotransferase [Bradyrhizobium sp. SBR1B]MBB4380325.1 glycine amidinotransferase [Bradyrhizobium sp. SBR1B]